MANWFRQRMEQETGGALPPIARREVVPTYQQPYQQEALPQQVPQQQGFDVEQLDKTPENVLMLMNHWTGGEGTKTETNKCPSCGGNHYFSRSQGTMRGPAPAPMCYTCGYNGMFEQADQSTWSAP
jgi:hypothetical protein